MNYRHAFHAGNHADCLKHWALTLCLNRIAAKPAPFAVIDTHAGIARYDLTGEEARRCPEWRDGIARLWDWTEVPAELAPYLEAVRAENPDGALRVYPGSPALALSAMGEDDRLIACELHQDDSRSLRDALRSDRRAQVHMRDGFTAVKALAPPNERRGLVLIDPPYEDRPGELAQSIEALQSGMERFGHGVWLWWRPLIDPAEIDRADAELASKIKQFPQKHVRVDLSVGARAGLSASSMLILNPPFGVAEALSSAGGALAARLAQGVGAKFRLTGASQH